MTTTYKNMTDLCKAHKTPNYTYNRADVINILQQFFGFASKQNHNFYRDSNPWYEQILDIFNKRNLGSLFVNDNELMMGLELAMMDIKTTVLNKFESMILAPHIVLRSHNLFMSLSNSLQFYIRSTAAKVPVNYPVSDNQQLYIVQEDERGAKYTSKGSVNKAHKVISGYIANLETYEVIEESLTAEQVMRIVNGTF